MNNFSTLQTDFRKSLLLAAIPSLQPGALLWVTGCRPAGEEPEGEGRGAAFGWQIPCLLGVQLQLKGETNLFGPGDLVSSDLSAWEGQRAIKTPRKKGSLE